MRLVVTAKEMADLQKRYREDDSNDALEIGEDAGKPCLLINLNHWQPCIPITVEG